MQLMTLQRNLNFTTDDLKANREGAVSDAQRERHQPAEVSKLAHYVILGHAVVIAGILGAIAIATGELAMWIVLGIVFAAGLLPFVLMQNEANIRPTVKADLERGKVKKVCGRAFITSETSQSRGTRYELIISDLKLRLTAKQAGAFVNEGMYCIYYLPLSQMLLSAEPTTEA
ncbi:MAG: hypothetical protein AAFQ07_11680 [Chloroflexota bacterium]